ncbi:MAG: hypothetical protein ACI8Y4_000314 [Candidatus Poriferisodalaceae bacterium]|jgi:hypothetical protein
MDPTEAPDNTDDPIGEGWPRRRLTWLASGVLLAVWAVSVGFTMLGLRSDAAAASSQAQRFLDPALEVDRDVVRDELLASAEGRLDAPWAAPLRWVPGARSQMLALDNTVAAASDVAEIGVEALENLDTVRHARGADDQVRGCDRSDTRSTALDLFLIIEPDARDAVGCSR